MSQRVALVTGGTRGIGLAIARALGQSGCRLVLTYLRNHRRADESREELKAEGFDVTVLQADSANRKDTEEVFAFLRQQHQRLDVLVSNGSAGFFGPTLATSDTEWRWTMDSNAKALLMQAQLGAPLMEGHAGKIVTLTSSGADRAVENYGVIGVAKAAQAALVRYLAKELGPKGINVNAVCAGLVDTEALAPYPDRKLLLRWVRLRTPMRRLTTVEDVAKAVVFLCGPQSDMIHGHTLVVDGGLSIRS